MRMAGTCLCPARTSWPCASPERGAPQKAAQRIATDLQVTLLSSHPQSRPWSGIAVAADAVLAVAHGAAPVTEVQWGASRFPVIASFQFEGILFLGLQRADTALMTPAQRQPRVFLTPSSWRPNKTITVGIAVLQWPQWPRCSSPAVLVALRRGRSLVPLAPAHRLLRLHPAARGLLWFDPGCRYRLFQGAFVATPVSKWWMLRAAVAAALRITEGSVGVGRALHLNESHWLELLDRGHRFAACLRQYHAQWLRAGTRTPFFQWLDYGEGRRMHISGECDMRRVHRWTVAEVPPGDRWMYEVQMTVGPDRGLAVRWRHSERGRAPGRPQAEGQAGRWAWVWDTTGRLYMGRKHRGQFHHGSLLGWRPLFCAGTMEVDAGGRVVAITPHSGHYKPAPEHLLQFVQYLRALGTDLQAIQWVKPTTWTQGQWDGVWRDPRW